MTEAAETLSVESPAPASSLRASPVPAVTPRSRQCPACLSPIEPGTSFCCQCGNRMGREEGAGADVLKTGFTCNSCGASVQVEADQRSYRCAFCDSTYVVEFAPQTDRQRPEFILPFGITAAEANRRFRAWIGGSWFAPSDLARRVKEGELQGVYLPFWSFSVRAEAKWRAEIGEHWYETVTETYTYTDSKGNSKTGTRTKRIQHTEWYPLMGRWHGFRSHYLVTASKGLSQEWVDRIAPFEVAQMVRFKPFILAGWTAEEYTIEKGAALQVAQEEYRREVISECEEMLPGDTHRALEAEIAFGDATSDLILLPIWIAAYPYAGKTYRFVMNGQTGEMMGERPTSWMKIVFLVGGIVLVILVIAAILKMGAS